MSQTSRISWPVQPHGPFTECVSQRGRSETGANAHRTDCSRKTRRVTSEVRYYYDVDLQNASRVVASARDAGVNVASSRKMPTMKTARPGLLELWIGQNDLSPWAAATDRGAHTE